MLSDDVDDSDDEDIDDEDDGDDDESPTRISRIFCRLKGVTHHLGIPARRERDSRIAS